MIYYITFENKSQHIGEKIKKMENMVNLIITVGLQRDIDSGDVVLISLPVLTSVAERVCREQENCQLLSECGDLTSLLNAYAVMNGYQCAWFVSASVGASIACPGSEDELIEENASLREEVLFLQGEVESLKKDYAALDKENRTANTKQYNEGKADGVRQMQALLKIGRIHFDGISLKAIPFDSVDAVAEKVLREVADGK